jgi:hypothetical protein
MFPLSLLLILGACGSSEDAVDAPAQEIQPQEKVEAPEAEAEPVVKPLSKTEAALALADSGRHGEAVAALEALLEKEAKNAAWWQLLGQEAILSKEPGALLDRLDADTAIGGERSSHQRLRATLALAAERPEDALEAAKKLRKTDDEEGAAFWVMAWQGLEKDAKPELDPAAMDPTKVGDALVLAATGPVSKRKVLLTDLAPKHPRAQLLRARLLEEVGVKGQIDLTLPGLLTHSDPEYRLFAGLASGGTAEDPAVAAGHYAVAAKAATEMHNGASAGAALSRAVASYLKALRSDEALTLALEIHAPRSEAKDNVGGGLTGLAVARAALAAGEVRVALSHARAASMAFAESDNSAMAAEAAWVQAEAAWHLGLSNELTEAATRAGDHTDAVNALALLLNGKPADAVDTLARVTLPGSSGVQVLLAAARAASYSGGDTVGLANKAARAAQATGHLPSQIEAQLALESYAFAAGQGRTASRARSALSRIAAGLENSAPLASEVAARTIRAGGSASFPSEGAPDSAAAWTALSTGEVPDAAEGENPIYAWARARAAAKASDHEATYAGYHAAAAATPTHLAGPWAPLSILDGGLGSGTEADMAVLTGRSDLLSGLAALSIHDDWRARGDTHVAFAVGDDPSLALETDARMALNEAHRRLGVQTVRWFAGASDPPEAAKKTVTELHKTALENKAFKRSLALPPADYRAIQESLKHVAILSYRLGANTGDAVVVTANGSRVVKLRDVPGIRKNAATLRADLESGLAMGGKASSPIPGDKLRMSLIDIFQQDLLGIGRYLVLPDGPLWGFSFGVLPEQQKGLRFLADIRSIGNSSTVAQAYKEAERPPLTYNPDFLGIAAFTPSSNAAAGSLKLPSEVANAGRLFGSGLREVKENADATASVLREKGPTARFMHMSDIHVGERAGLKFYDESVALHELREMDLVAQAAILSANSSPEVMRRRGQALVAAGARSVILASWLVPESVRGKYLYTFYEAGNRDRPPSRAMVEARESIQKNPQDPNFDPSYWGQFILHGLP